MLRSVFQVVGAGALALAFLVPGAGMANEVALPTTEATSPAEGAASGPADISALAEALVEAANRRGTASGVLASVHGLPGGGPARAVLRPESTIERPFIHLGDVFGGLSRELSQVPVGHAPAPGERVVLDVHYLNDLAEEYGVPWTAASRFVQTVVARRGYEIGREEVLQTLRRHLVAAGMQPEAEVEVSALNVHATVGAPEDVRIAVRDLYYDDRTGRFNALLNVPADGPNARPVRLTGAVHVSVEVPVLTRPLRRGMIVTAEDVRWDSMRRGDLRPDILLDTEDLIGKAARQNIQSGRPVRANQVIPPEVVSRNAAVTMVLETPFMTVTARGRALEDGAVGDTVRVANVASNKEVLAEVTGRNTVRVRPDSMTAGVY
ncbi:flagellar basal body P-ring formation chaperone FlgA [uncultured Rhodospira sp.]|uniref:flagellar basal body P-ring formation chaperone FlgA n=1 Tax=uncultured Rhodospira sp. TaxID=1936189 RepID=UPI00262B24FB|nr:flagellar basal body P-ring formation chaperone FlgA [uncultured Rhodospira sp.]